MKSAIYTPYLDTFGGGERYILTIAEYLNQHHEVDVFWDGDNLLHQQAERLNLDLANCRIVPNIFAKSFAKRWSTLRQYNNLVYLSDGSFPLGLAKNNILHLQVPFDLANEKTLKNKIKLATWQQIIVNSQFTKSYVDQTYGIKSTLLYPPVAIDEFQPRKKEKLILSVGRFVAGDKGKRQDMLIDAFQQITGQLKDWKLVLAGSIWDRPFYDQLQLASAGLPVEFYGDAPFETLKRLYGEATIYWHAQGFEHQEAQFTEHFGMSTVEAMAAECVPIVYNAGGQKEIVKQDHNGLLWNTVAELTQETVDLIKNQERLAKLKEQARQTSQQFSKERFIKQLATITH